jgi:hypothetical protein
MGLLDEAIREHLDLKRRQGADPGEIARKEREALEPVVPDEPATWGADPAAAPHDASEQHDEMQHEEPAVGYEEHTATPEARAIDLSTVGQETAEIDMREVLGEDGNGFDSAYPTGHEAPAPVRAGRITGSPAVAAEAQELEWEVAGRVSGEPPQEIPGQESLSFE